MCAVFLAFSTQGYLETIPTDGGIKITTIPYVAMCWAHTGDVQEDSRVATVYSTAQKVIVLTCCVTSYCNRKVHSLLMFE
jgi:hypothetical protein